MSATVAVLLVFVALKLGLEVANLRWRSAKPGPA